MHRHGVTMDVCAPSRVSSHIHYINSDLLFHFLICGYGIFLSLRCAMSYLRTMYTYDLCISFPFSFISKLWRHFFVPFSFFSALYTVLSLSVSTLDSILSPPVSVLDSIYSWFGLTVTAFPSVRGQYMQVLLDKIKYDPDWYNVSTSYEPFQLLALIKKTVLAETEYQYPFATFYKQWCSVYSFSPNTLINEQWYERFNTKIDVGSTIDIIRQHQVLLCHVAE